MNTFSNRLFTQRGRGRGTRKSVLLGLILALLLLFAGKPQSVYAASITVTTTDDELNADGDCSLREAIQAANTDIHSDACPAGNGADTITVPAGTYTLSIAGAGEDANETGDFDITSDVTLQGAGAAATIIDGADLDRVLHILAGQVQILGVTISNGTSTGLGGGILNNGTLTITNSVIADNTAENGGAILNQRDLDVTSSSFTGNTTTCCGGAITNHPQGVAIIANSMFSNNDSVAGGAFNNVGGDLILTGVTLINNTARNGGGVFNSGNVSIAHSQVAENSVTDGGGGIFNGGGGVAAISTSTITDNRSQFRGGGLVNDSNSSVEIKESTLSNNQALDTNDMGWAGEGGAVSNYGMLTITNSTISSNSVLGYGGGIINRGTVQIEGSILSGNQALDNINGPGDGGAVRNLGMLNITQSTISSNSASASGGGIRNHSFGNDVATLTITGSVITDNSAEGGGAINNEGSLSVTDSSFTGNTATCCGGAIGNNSVATIENSTFSDNSSVGGGALNNFGGDLTLIDVKVIHNMARDGAGLFNMNSGIVSITHSTFKDNLATGHGGGILSFDGGVLTIERSIIYRNSAGDFGGGIYNGGTATLKSSEVNYNTASQGGGIYNNDSLSLISSVVTGNRATSGPGSGGGILNDGGTVTLTKSRVRGNRPDNCIGC